VHDEQFLALTARAMETTLENAEQLGEEAMLFPLGPEGVAQGSPLSPLMGNILLAKFDEEMNGRGITCLRYVDDFLLLGPDSKKVRKAFESAQTKLAVFGMAPYDPAVASEKAEAGETAGGFDFLGCRVLPGFVQPSEKARKKLLRVVDERLKVGRAAMTAAAEHPRAQLSRSCLVQTLSDLDNVLRGWRHSFSFCNNFQVFEQLDATISKALREFIKSGNGLLKGPDPAFRRALGVQLLSDIPIAPSDDAQSQ
jgi:hypothetical protein